MPAAIRSTQRDLSIQPLSCWTWFVIAGMGPLDVVAEVASGTGKLTKRLVEDAQLEVYAVEPNHDMRQRAERAFEGHPLFHSIDGSAAALNLPQALWGYIKAVVVGQALHWWRDQWLDAVKAWREVLHPAGKLLIFTYHLSDTHPISQAFDGALRAVCPSYDVHAAKVLYGNSSGFADSEHERYFDSADCHRREVTLPLSLNEASFMAGVMSMSFAPSPTAEREQQERFLIAMRQFFSAHARDGLIEVPYILKAWHGSLTRLRAD